MKYKYRVEYFYKGNGSDEEVIGSTMITSKPLTNGFIIFDTEELIKKSIGADFVMITKIEAVDDIEREDQQ